MWDDERSSKRSLGIRDKKILYERAKHKCECCGNEIEFAEMQVGHKIAYVKGGSATLRNSVCLCYKCNNLQGTDSWNTFMKKLGKTSEGKSPEIKDALKRMTLSELKTLAKNHKITVKGTIEEGFLYDTRLVPTKTQYVTALSKRLSEEDIRAFLK